MRDVINITLYGLYLTALSFLFPLGPVEVLFATIGWLLGAFVLY